MELEALLKTALYPIRVIENCYDVHKGKVLAANFVLILYK